MPHGGSLTIGTREVDLDEHFRKIHGFGGPGRFALLSVSDTGIGMDKRTMEHIFDPFFTTKEVGKGTGLGLASVYGIVKQHEGYVDVSSELLRGTTFDIYLPLAEFEHQKRVDAREEVERGTERVLVVEDDDSVRNMVKLILTGHGYRTLEATDGEDAVRVYRANRGSIDLVILDVVMPRMNGKEVLDEILRMDRNVKAIFVSGYTGDIMSEKGIRSENVDFVQKPLSATRLLSKVRKVLDR
jgi:CheY-like chemotaxis protein